METIHKRKTSKLRCSVIGLSAEMYICKHLSQETGGLYSVAVDEVHLKDLLLEHAPPPPAIAGNKPGPCVTCCKCKHYFCLDCDIYIHESIHNCPGCESIHRPKSVSLMEE